MAKLNRSQRRAFARVVMHGFLVLEALASTTRFDEWFLEAMTQAEREELARLKKVTNKLADRWRELGWKLEGRNAGK